MASLSSGYFGEHDSGLAVRLRNRSREGLLFISRLFRQKNRPPLFFPRTGIDPRSPMVYGFFGSASRALASADSEVERIKIRLKDPGQLLSEFESNHLVDEFGNRKRTIQVPIPRGEFHHVEAHHLFGVEYGFQNRHGFIP